MGGPVGKQDEAAGRGGELSLLHGEHDRALQDIDSVVQLVVHVHGWVGAVGVESALHDAEAPLGVAGHRLEGHGVGPEDQLPALTRTEEYHLRHLVLPWRARQWRQSKLEQLPGDGPLQSPISKRRGQGAPGGRNGLRSLTELGR